YAGVAGYVKAVFRWNAPPQKTINIGQIGGGQPVAIYPGMMNAAANVLPGTITEKAFLAGEVAFVTATTNNIVVSVDFASWVRTADNNPLILGNVAGSPPWTDTISTAVEFADGSIGIYLRPLTDSASQVVSSLASLEVAYSQWLGGVRSTKPIPLR